MNIVDFKNRKTKQLHEELLLKDNERYSNYLKYSIPELFDGGNNAIDSKINISFDCIHAIEIYNRTNKKKVEKIFSKFVSLCKNNENKYSNLKNAAQKYVFKIIENIDKWSLSTLPEFKIKCNLKYISHITMNLDCIGANLFKINFRCWLSDYAKYKYWLLSCPNVLQEICLKKERINKKENYSITQITGNHRKRKLLCQHTHNAYNEINNYISSIAPGIFSKNYKKLPCILNINYKYLPSILPKYIFTKYHAIFIEQKTPSYIFKNIIDFDGYSDSYTNNNDGNTFVSIIRDFNSEDDIIMKYFRTDNSIPVDMSWLSIVYFLLYDQKKSIELLKNTYYENDIYGKTLDLKEYRKKVSKIVPIFELIKSCFTSDDIYGMNYSSLFSEYKKITEHEKISFLDDFKSKIDFFIKSNEKEIITIKEISINNNTVENTKVNKKMLWIAFCMLIMTLFQAITQCNNIGIIKKMENIFLRNNVIIESNFINNENIEKLHEEKIINDISNVENILIKDEIKTIELNDLEEDIIKKGE